MSGQSDFPPLSEPLVGAWYLKLNGSAATEGFIRFWSWIIILQTMVPIALLVSSEVRLTRALTRVNSNRTIFSPCRLIVIPDFARLVPKQVAKTCQKIFMQWDSSFFDARTGKSLIVQSSTLNEDLGQIERVFSDKTGTLTQNIMEFKVHIVLFSVLLFEDAIV
jgi:magnesium-transporting ATPase (P-type)